MSVMQPPDPNSRRLTSIKFYV